MNKLKYIEYWKNKNDVILILHWWWWSSDSWKAVWKLLEKENYRVIIPELPWSTKVELKKSYTLEDMAILVENLVKELWLNDIILLWHSNWGALAILLASKLNLWIKKLLLNNSAGIRKDFKRNFKRNVLKTFTKIIKPLKKWKHFSKTRELFYKAIWSQDYLRAEKNPHLKETYLNMINSDLSKNMQMINNQTFLIRGEKDSYTPLWDAKKIKKQIKDSQLIILDWERHWIHLDNPKRLVKEIIKIILC